MWWGISVVASNADFGPLVIETDVDSAVVQTLRKWMPTYLAQAERERTLATRLLARPRSYANTLDDDEFLDHSLPAVIVTTAQTQGNPAKDGMGTYYAAWRVVVSAVVRGRTPPETRTVAALFGGCVRRILVQKPSLEGFAGDLKWVSSNLAGVADVSGNGRFLAAAVNEFVVYVDEVVALGGPHSPSPYPEPDPNDPDAPYDPLKAVGDVTVSVTEKENA